MLTRRLLAWKLNRIAKRGSFLKNIRLYTCNNYFVTTPIFYVNAAPHIGHLYTAVLADSVARWHVLKGGRVTFTTGTDEHGLKIQQAAEKLQMTPQSHCDQISNKFKELFSLADIQYTDFIRTTEVRHKHSVSKFWETLQKNGYIYKGGYEGWYCVSDEAFLSENDVTEITEQDGSIVKVAIDSQQPVIWTKEENYMFRLSAFKEGLMKWIDEGVIKPQKFEGTVRQMVDDLQDLSVSRKRYRLNWGIPVPGDDTQTIYVWLDALVNYLTVSDYPDLSHDWPPDCHVVGKDILRFHAVYWPAFLMAANLPLPKRIQCHSHWLIDNCKMSKSRGNVVDPIDRIDRYTEDGLRYFLLKEGVPHSDGNYNDTKAVDYLNNDLSNTLGNLLSRCTSRKINSNMGQIFPALDREILEWKFSQNDIEMYRSLQQLPDIVDDLYKEYDLYKVIDCTQSYLRWANRLLQDHEPWQLTKTIDTFGHLKCLLHIVFETLRVNGIILQPIIPKVSSVLLDRLGISKEERMVKHISLKSNEQRDTKLGQSINVLFPRIQQDD